VIPEAKGCKRRSCSHVCLPPLNPSVRRLLIPVYDKTCRRQCLETVTENILAKGGEITVNMAPKAVSAREDSELAAQMERLAMEGEQVDGDDDDDEGSDDE